VEFEKWKGTTADDNSSGNGNGGPDSGEEENPLG